MQPVTAKTKKTAILLVLAVAAIVACESKLPDGVIIEESEGNGGDGDGSPTRTVIDEDDDGIPDGIDTDGDGEADITGTAIDENDDGSYDGLDVDGDGSIDEYFPGKTPDNTPVDRNDPSCQSSPLERFSTIVPGGQHHPDAVSTLSLMTNTEKIAILSGGDVCPQFDCDFDATGVPSQGIKDFRLRDGPRGVHTHNGTVATTFAVAIARGASFDTDLEYRVGRIQGIEMTELNYDLTLAPQINTIRHPRWARSQESYSEDPLVLGKFGAAYVRGMQEFVPACPKHFAANNTDENRETMSANMDEQTLRENYSLAFKIVVEESDPACIMAAYNRVNGLHATENPHLLTDILRDDWGWGGFVLSDWWSTTPDAGAETLNAGLDLEMPDERAFRTLGGELGSTVSLERIDEAALRILNVRARFGQLDENYNSEEPNQDIVEDPDHRALARETAEKGAVLLKNDDILPIGDSVGSILVMGPDAFVPITNTDEQGVVHGLGDRGSSNTNPPYAISYIQGIGDRAAQAGITVEHSNTPADAASADLVIIPVTMQHEDEGEAFGGGGDRDTMTLGGAHPTHWDPKPSQFINSVAAQNSNVVVLIATGSAVLVEDWIGSAKGIVQTFYPGQEGGRAVANLLFGDVNFSGKLPFTVGTSESQYPYFGNQDDSVDIQYLHGYEKFETEGLSPRFWFGYGLSYTTFEYSDLEILCDSISSEGAVNAKATITNTGSVAGDEVVMAFVGYPGTAARRPVKEIKQWRRTGLLAPGESKEVYFSIPVRDLRYWADGGWTLEDLEYRLTVSASADPTDQNKLETTFRIE